MTRNMESAIALILGGALGLYALSGCLVAQPVLPHELMEVLVVHASSASELDQRDLLDPVQNEHVGSRVLSLLASGGPAAVPWLVVAVCVDPVERASIRAWAHVGKKGGEAIAPFVAHSDASSAVHFKSDRLRVIAPLFGLAPRSIFRRGSTLTASAERGFVSTRVTSGYFSVKAAATLSAASEKVIPVDGFFGPAIASAEPLDSSATDIGGSAQHSEPAELLPSHVMSDGAHRLIVLQAGSEQRAL